MTRNDCELYPDFRGEIEAIDKAGISVELLQHIIAKHKGNSEYNKKLRDRYKAIESGVPIFERKPRFEEDSNIINNKVNNDFFAEIIDIKTGYFAGKPFAYSYSHSTESEMDTGGEQNIDKATKALSDFTTRSSMYNVDQDMTKYAAMCGYCGRLLYIDLDGEPRAMIVPPWETIILSKNGMGEPSYAIRYYEYKDWQNNSICKAEFYDETSITFFSGNSWIGLQEEDKQPHCFDYCPLQGIENNAETLGDAERVLALIDAYDRSVSDAVNEVESFANSYMVFENIPIDDDMLTKAAKTGAISFSTGMNDGKVYFLTKENTGQFQENELNRLQENIYKFSKTPNLSDISFSQTTGTALKFKLVSLEAKCGMFQSKLQAANTYMFKVLASCFRKKRIDFDPLQAFVNYKRNFPLDLQAEADAATKLLAAGIPMRIVLEQLSFIDDVDYAMQLIEDEKSSIPSLMTMTAEDNMTDNEESSDSSLFGGTDTE